MSKMVYQTDIDGVKIVVDTKTWEIDSYRGVSDSGSKALPKYMRINDNLFYMLKGKAVDNTVIYSGSRDKTKGNIWKIDKHSDWKVKNTKQHNLGKEKEKTNNE